MERGERSRVAPPLHTVPGRPMPQPAVEVLRCAGDGRIGGGVRIEHGGVVNVLLLAT